MDDAKEKIRRLNDRLRKDHIGGQILVTAGIQNLGDQAVAKIIEAVAAFEEFTEENDPYNEHDFGACTVQGQKIFWKVDCYARDMQHHSPDPANPLLTKRVLTIMLAEEY